MSAADRWGEGDMRRDDADGQANRVGAYLPLIRPLLISW